MSRYFLFPFRAAPLALVVSFTIGLLLAIRSRINGIPVMGIPLALVLVSWFFKYCFVLLDAIIAGEDHPPVLSAEMVNPVDEQRPLAQAALIVAGLMLVGAAGRTLGTPVATVCAVVLVFALPASIAVLALSGNPFKAAYPVALFELIRSVGASYLLLNAITLTAAGLFVWLIRSGAPVWTLIAGTQVLLLLTFSLVGGVVFEHRHELGLDSRSRREFEAEREAREHVSERGRMIDRAYAKFRVSKPLEGWQEIEQWLTAHGQGERLAVERSAILQAACRWDDVRPADRLASDLIGWFLVRRETGRALEVLQERLRTHPNFRPASTADATRLAELAAAAGKPGLRRQLLGQ
jgi:hypothetical protein